MKKLFFLMSILLFTLTISCSKQGSTSNAQEAKNNQPVVETVQKTEIPSTHYEKLLTAEEVSQVSKIKNIKSLPKNKEKRKMGDINFVSASNNQDILVVNIMPARPEELPKYREEYKKHKYIEIDGIGDAAFISGQKVMNLTISQLVFIKGSLSIILTSSLDPATMKNYLGIEELKKLSKIMISRL